METISTAISSLNNSKYFAGLVLLMMNIGSKYITIELSKTQEQYLRNVIAKQFLIFSICWMGTRDIVTSIILTAAFIVLTEHLFNEESSLCILPAHWIAMKDAIDANGDNVISQDEINRAVKILEQAKKQENQREAFNMLRQYSMLTSSA
jgi:hypothetical protein